MLDLGEELCQVGPSPPGYSENDCKLLCILEFYAIQSESEQTGLICSALSSETLENPLSQEPTLHPL